ncbi:TolC family protein [Pararobbsia silviterrae]|uniref:TolC family protein n=1 Tax=Pararobbsia silviterrae TaxID=1792498 RepID=A0A494YGS1_9BURK|nr:TolC family protein [Pararobbsia silviterrae]RKP59227.1 TolC family protein [Pararobbsia silviterrae]
MTRFSNPGARSRSRAWIAHGARLTTLAASIALLVACADLTPPDARAAYDAAMSTPLPDAWAAAADGAAFRSEWIGFDTQDELRGLIDEAFEHSPDMRVAATRVEQARLQGVLAGAALWPTVGTGGRWSNSLISDDALSLSGVFASASWEVDLWGVARAGVGASEARYRSAEADYVYARASLGAAVAKAWLMNLEAAREVGLLKQIDDDTARQRALVKTRVEIGKASEAELTQSDASVQAAHERWLNARQGREAAQRSLELLLGRYPAAQIEVDDVPALFGDTALPAVPAGVPLDVLERRPDLVASRHAFVAAFFDAEQAKAARLPNIALTTSVGYLDTRSVALRNQLDGLVFPVGAKVTWPLFDAGRRKTESAIATVEQSEAAAQYARAIERAMGEVEQALGAEREFNARADTLAKRQVSLERATALSEIEREVGRAEAFDVLAKRIDMLHAQIAHDQARVAMLAARIDLHLALGGSFFDEHDRTVAVAHR